jgi:4-amino-4-deoxy-L-arabinose transferase
LLIALAVGFLFQGSRGLYESTEGRYAESAREMIETHDWLIPRLDYEPHLTKPPMAYWVIAAGMKLLGKNTWGARAGNAVAFVLMVLVIERLGILLWDERTGFLAALVFATSPFALVGANGISTDMLLALWSSLAVLSYWRAMRSGKERGAARWMLGMWFFSALGFLTKGTPALLAPLVILVFHFQMRRRRQVPGLKIAAGIPILIAVGLSWYVYVAAKYSGTASYFLGEEVFGRIFTSRFHRNPQWYAPLYVYLLPLGLGLGPWLVYLPRILRGKRRPGGSGGEPLLAGGPERLFLLVWFLLPLVVLSISRSRLPLYVLPFFPALVLAFSRLIISAASPSTPRRLRATAVVGALLLVGLKAAGAYYPTDLDMSRLYRACKLLDDGRRPFYLYKERGLHGLQFYFDGRLERVDDAVGDRKGWMNLASAIDATKAYPEEGAVFIVKKSNTSLEHVLQHSGVGYARRGGAGPYLLLDAEGTPAEKEAR